MTYIREIVLGLLVLYILWLLNSIDNMDTKIRTKDSMIVKLQETVAKRDTTIELQNAIVDTNAVDRDTHIKELPKTITKIETKYQVVYRDIEAIKGDGNATCKDMVNALNDFKY